MEQLLGLSLNAPVSVSAVYVPVLAYAASYQTHIIVTGYRPSMCRQYYVQEQLSVLFWWRDVQLV